MPSKTKSTKTIEDPVLDEADTPKKRRISFNSLSRINVIYILFLLLIIASFLIGVLVTKVQYLEKGGATDTTTQAINDGSAPQAPTGPVDVDQGHLPVLGEDDAKVTVVEFSDFQCPFCKSLFEESLPQIKKDFVDTGKIKFAYRHYPLTSIHTNAQKAAEASECANEQDNFWGYHDELFKNQADWEALDSAAAQEKFVEYANAIGLDGATLGKCVSGGVMVEKVQEDIDDGNSAGVDGTPATFINGYLITGAVPYEEFKSLIEQELEK